MSAVMNPPLTSVGLPPPLPPAPPVPRPLRWTREQFVEIASWPDMQNRRLELIRGVIWEHEPMNTPHAAGVSKCRRRLDRLFGEGWDARAQLPLDLSADTLPKPDVFLVPFREDEYSSAHPTNRECALVVEVADTTLQYDLTVKAELYATAGIPEYWVLDLNARVLHVLRDPGTVAANGTAYRSQQQLGPDDSVTPLAAPDRSVKVADLLP